MVANHVSGKELTLKNTKNSIAKNKKSTKQPNQTMASPEDSFSEEDISMDGQRVYEKMLKIIQHKENASQTHTEMSPRTW